MRVKPQNFELVCRGRTVDLNGFTSTIRDGDYPGVVYEVRRWPDGVLDARLVDVDRVCSSCNAPLTKEDLVCPWCRTKVKKKKKQDKVLECCPECGEQSVSRQNGCKLCMSCGWSLCS